MLAMEASNLIPCTYACTDTFTIVELPLIIMTKMSYVLLAN